MGGRGGGRKGGSSRSARNKARFRKQVQSRIKSKQFKNRFNTGVRGDYNAGMRGWNAFNSGYSSQVGATPRDQIPGTAEYAQRVRKEEAKEKVTKAESGFGDTLKKALSIASFATAPGILSGLNVARQFGLGKDSKTDYSKAFAPQSLADKYGAWSPQNLSRFYGATTDPGDWNLAMDNTVDKDLPGEGFGISQELRKVQKALSDQSTPKHLIPGLQKRNIQLQSGESFGLVNNFGVDWSPPQSYQTAEVSDTSDVNRDWFGEGSLNEGEYGIDRTMDTLEGLGLGIEITGIKNIQNQTMNPKDLLGKFRNVDPRIKSLYTVHVSMLIFSMGNSIIVTGIWPYLQAVSTIKH